MWFVGIDWSKKHLDYCLLQSDGAVAHRDRVDNTEKGFARLLSELGKHDISLESLAVSIESPHQRVVDFLLARKVAVYPVNPKSISDYRSSCKVSGSKSDTADAQLIATYLLHHHQSLRKWHCGSLESRKLKLLLNDRDQLVTEKVRLENQLRETLDSYYPQATAAFRSVSCKSMLTFLSRYPTFEVTAENKEEDWIEFLNEMRIYNPTSREKFIAAMGQPEISIDKPIAQTKSMLTLALVKQLAAIVNALAEYNEMIETLIVNSSDGQRFRSLPGVDVILAAKLLAAIGTDRNRFSSANELQALFGTAPYTKQSGRHRGVSFRQACDRKLRAALNQMALSSLTKSQWARSYYDRKRKEGKRSHHAFRCLANLWVRVIFSMWKKHTQYDQNKHLASIAKHQLAQA
jgi:transposase